MDFSTLGAASRLRADAVNRDDLIVRYEHAVEAEQAEQARYLKARLRFNDQVASFDNEVSR